MKERGPIPRLNETAGEARIRGCFVPERHILPDDAIVMKIIDAYPEVYAWTIYWSTGITSGVMRPDDASGITFSILRDKS